MGIIDSSSHPSYVCDHMCVTCMLFFVFFSGHTPVTTAVDIYSFGICALEVRYDLECDLNSHFSCEDLFISTF